MLFRSRLAAWTNDLAEGFRNWLDEADRTGRLNEMIETGITKLKEFGVLVREAGELVYILGSAAERAGFSGLKEMSEGLEQVNEDLKANQDVLDDYFSGAALMADGFKSAIGSIVSGLGEFSGTFETISADVQSVFESIGSAFEAILGDADFQAGVEDLFSGISSAMEDIESVSPQIADLLGSVASVAGTVVENIGEVGAKFIEAFGPEIVQILTAVEVPIDNLGSAVGNLIDALANSDGDFSLLTTLSSLVAAGLAEGLENLADGVQGLADALEALNDIMDEGISFDSIGDLFSGLTQMIAGWMGNSPALMGFNIVNWILRAFGLEIEWKGLKGVQERFTQIQVELQHIWDTFKRWLGSLFGNSSGGSSSFSLLDAVKNLLGIEDVDFSGLFDEPKRKLSEAWDGFKSGLDGLFSGGGGGMAGSLGSGWDLNFRLNAEDNATPVVEQAGWDMFGWANERYEAVLDALDNTGGPVEDARSGILAWAEDLYEAELEARDETGFGIGEARSAITRWMDRDYVADLEASNKTASGISSARGSILSKIVNATFRASVTMNSHVSGLDSVVRKIRAAVANFTANIRAVMPFAAGGSTPRPRPPRYLAEADGGVLAFANGGFAEGVARALDRRARYAAENHVAQIAPAGAWRLWAEPETGGEAYIPLALAKRERSTAILADVADRFGYRLEKFANGSEPNSTRSAVGGNTYNLSVQTLRPDVASEVTGDVMFHLKHMAYGGGRQDGF